MRYMLLRIQAMNLKTIVSVFFSSLLLCVTMSGQKVRMKDHSDWWSIVNENSHSPDIKPSSHDIDRKNFEIAGADVGTAFHILAAKLGKATVVERGDASTGRHQVCYMSGGAKPKTYLIFELGSEEGSGSTFYVFTGGADWKGSNLCAKSPKVSQTLSTASGLRLGLSPDQVKSILGPPDTTVGGKLVYSREFNRRATPAEFERQRQEYPDKLSDQQAHAKFDFLPVEIYIEAGFADSKLWYLAVSKSDE
jgi:hypothetical protein